jgi:hypothetical protein
VVDYLSRLFALLLLSINSSCGPEEINLDLPVRFVLADGTFQADLQAQAVQALESFRCQDILTCGPSHTTIMIRHENVSGCVGAALAVASRSYENRIIRICDRFYSQRDTVWLYQFIYTIKHELGHAVGGVHITCDGFNIMCADYDGASQTIASRERRWDLLTYSKADIGELCRRSFYSFCRR